MVEKVGYTRPVTTARALRKAGSISASGFAEALASAEGISGGDAVESAGSMAAIGSLGGLLGAQEVDEREARRRRDMKQGRSTLDTLEKLRDALLLGALPASTIHQLETLVAAERAETADPALRSILDEIAVRAAVELAKLEMSGLLQPAPDNNIV